jgi:hypothetical protein
MLAVVFSAWEDEYTPTHVLVEVSFAFCFDISEVEELLDSNSFYFVHSEVEVV